MTGSTKSTGSGVIIKDWKRRIGSDNRWAFRAALAIYNRQTESEKAKGRNEVVNGMGFSRVDCQIITQIVISSWHRRLSPRELGVLKGRMPKYAGQLYRMVYGNTNGKTGE